MTSVHFSIGFSFIIKDIYLFKGKIEMQLLKGLSKLYSFSWV